jgi:hypothetical protein
MYFRCFLNVTFPHHECQDSWNTLISLSVFPSVPLFLSILPIWLGVNLLQIVWKPCAFHYYFWSLSSLHIWTALAMHVKNVTLHSKVNCNLGFFIFFKIKVRSWFNLTSFVFKYLCLLMHSYIISYFIYFSHSECVIHFVLWFWNLWWIHIKLLCEQRPTYISLLWEWCGGSGSKTIMATSETGQT